jgi:hypothetical protein
MTGRSRPTDPKEWRFRQPATPALRRGALTAAPVGILLAFELATDSKLTGAISTGALLVGFVAFDAPARIRFLWQLLTAPLLGIGAALGVLTTEPAALAVAAMFLVGGLGGFCVAVSMRLAIAAMTVVLALLIAQGQFIPVGDAFPALLLVTAGGLAQSLVALAAWSLWDRETEPFDLRRGASAAARVFAANLTLQSPSMRHALRWGGALAIGVAIYRALDFHDHGFWIPLTTLFVLKPDPDQTIERILMRAAGTAAGLVLATAFAEAFLNDAVPVALVLTVSAAVCYAFLAIEYALFTTAITVYMVLLADSLGEPALRAAGERGIGTAAGILIAALAILSWPERGSIEPIAPPTPAPG